jgi:hypothetical protein
MLYTIIKIEKNQKLRVIPNGSIMISRYIPSRKIYKINCICHLSNRNKIMIMRLALKIKT